MKTTIKDCLHSCVPGISQTVGYMQVIPLISEVSFDGFISFRELEYRSSQYGIVCIENPLRKKSIVPRGTDILIKKGAQDHAILETQLFNAKRKEYTVLNAVCIQNTQSGHFVGPDTKDVSILPYFLREVSFDIKQCIKYGKKYNYQNSGYGRFWGAVAEFNSQFGIEHNRAYISDFIEKMAKELDENIAHFERIYQQRGAIILIDGDVIGIEVAPSYEYWKDEWEPLVRETYGSFAIQYRQLYGEAPFPKTRERLSSDVSTLQEIEKELKRVFKKEQINVKTIIRDLMKLSLELTKTDNLDSLQSYDIKNDRFVGNIVKDDDAIVYVSLMSKKTWFDHRNFHNAKEFTI